MKRQWTLSTYNRITAGRATRRRRAFLDATADAFRLMRERLYPRSA
jgi:hypothetical protein